MTTPATPRGLVSRSLIAAAVFAAAVVPGWLLANQVERWTGSVVSGYLVSMAYQAAAIAVLAPWGSYRRRAAALGLVPLVGFYLCCVLAWRVALLPWRDWEPRSGELPRARWLDDPRFAGTWLLEPAPPARSVEFRRPGPARVRGRS